MLIALLLFAPAPAPALAKASGGELTACVARQLPADTPEAMFAQAGRFDCEIKQAALGRTRDDASLAGGVIAAA